MSLFDRMRRWFAPPARVSFADRLDEALQDAPLSLRVEAWERSLPSSRPAGAPFSGAADSPVVVRDLREPLTPHTQGRK